MLEAITLLVSEYLLQSTKSRSMKIMDEELKPSRTYQKSTPFVVSKDEWVMKEGPGKSMKKNALYAQRHGKRYPWAEVRLNSEKIKPVALAIFELCTSEGRQAGRQAVS